MQKKKIIKFNPVQGQVTVCVSNNIFECHGLSIIIYKILRIEKYNFK